MLIKFCNAFTKITAWPVQKLIFRTKIHYADKTVQGRRIKGPAILVSNHTSVFDYAAWLFVFYFRTLRFQMAELLFDKQPLGLFLKAMGGIRVNRNTHEFGFLHRSRQILDRGGVVGIFPESRIPRPGEPRPLEFKPSAALLALTSGVPVIPVYTDGAYFCRKRAHVVIGTPVYAADLTEEGLTEKENILRVSEALRTRIVELERICHEQGKQTAV